MSFDERAKREKINLIFLISTVWHCTAGTHSMFQDGAVEIREREIETSSVYLGALACLCTSVCVCVYVYVCVTACIYVCWWARVCSRQD